MKKEYLNCLISLTVTILAIIFTICAMILGCSPQPGQNTLLIVSIVMSFAGIMAFTANYKKYCIIMDLCDPHTQPVAKWVYPSESSGVIHDLILSQRSNSLASALFFFILCLIFCIILSHSGGTYILHLGYILAFICFCTFLVSIEIIHAYYDQAFQKESQVIFGTDCFYYLNELYRIQRGYYFLQTVYISPAITADDENCLVFSYGLYDVDEPPVYLVTVPIPSGKLETAEYIKNYYKNLIKNI